MSDVTRILSAIEHGDAQASAKLLPLVYNELRKLAAARMANAWQLAMETAAFRYLIWFAMEPLSRNRCRNDFPHSPASYRLHQEQEGQHGFCEAIPAPSSRLKLAPMGKRSLPAARMRPSGCGIANQESI